MASRRVVNVWVMVCVCVQFVVEIHELSRLQLLRNRVGQQNASNQNKIQSIFTSAMTFDRKPNGKHYAQFIFYTELFCCWLVVCFVRTLISTFEIHIPLNWILQFSEHFFFNNNQKIQQTCYHAIPFNFNSQIYIFFLSIRWLLPPNVTAVAIRLYPHFIFCVATQNTPHFSLSRKNRIK